jgi:hypothetical protein
VKISEEKKESIEFWGSQALLCGKEKKEEVLSSSCE